MDAVTNVPPPVNEPVRTYAPGRAERAALEARVKELAGERAELTMTIGGQQRMGSGDRVAVVQPHHHQHVFGDLGNATDAEVAAAIEAARAAAPGWRALSYDDRAAVLLKAAELLAGPWRATINAATVLGQSKSPFQAEIDAACELIDFWRYNVHFGRQLLAEQPSSTTSAWNRLEYRPLEGFVLAITPFNFTSIAGNLPTAPALMGNVVVWKPSPTQQLSAHYLMRLLEAAGLTPGEVNHEYTRCRGAVSDDRALAKHTAALARALPDAAAGGGRAAARRDQPGHRRWRRGVPGRADRAGPGRHPLHRVHRHVPAPVADGRGEHRRLPQLPAAGRRDRRQGLRHRAPVGRPGGAGHRADPGRVRVPGPEVLGSVPGLRGPVGVGPDG